MILVNCFYLIEIKSLDTVISMDFCFERHDVLFLELFADEVKGCVSGLFLFFLHGVCSLFLLLPGTEILLREFSHHMF